jgi:hypothetical protein
MKINNRQKLVWSLVAALAIVAVAFLGNFFIKQNYEQHHYVTLKIGGPHPHEIRMTQQRYEAISQEAETRTLQGIAAGNQRQRLQRSTGHQAP